MVLSDRALPFLWLGPFLLAIVLLLVWLVKLKKLNATFQRLGIPGPKPTLVFGNALDFANKCSLDVFKEWTKEYGSVFGFMEGTTPSVVITCPDLGREVLVKHFDKFADRPAVCPFKHDFSHLSLVNISGKMWKQRRHAMAATMSTRNVKHMFSVMASLTEDFLYKLDLEATACPDGFIVDDIITRYLVDWFCHSALGFPSNAMGDPNDLMNRYHVACMHSSSPENGFTGMARLFPFLTPLLQPFDKQHKQTSQDITKAMKFFVSELKEKFCVTSKGESFNLMQGLMTRSASLVGDGRSKMASSRLPMSRLSMTDEEIIGEITGLVGGGIGPLSAALIFCLYCLAVHRKQADEVREEIEAVVQEKNSVSFAQLHRMPRLDNFIFESLRTYPVAPGVSRDCIETCTINGITFEQGMVVRILSYITSHDEKYFPSPSTFNPDRFLSADDVLWTNSNDPEDIESKKSKNSTSSTSSNDVPITPLSKSSGKFLPYGLGPRMCAGQRLARLCLKLTLVRVLQTFDLTTSSSTQVPLKIALRPHVVPQDGVHIKLTRRGVI